MDNKLTDLNTLYRAFRASMEGSSWKEEPQRFEIDFLSELVALKREIKGRTYATSEGSTFMHTERGKKRLIHGGRMRDRVIRHALCDEIITPMLRPYLIYNNGASQKGKGISFARGMFERDLHNYWIEHRSNDGYIGFIDLSKFYDNMQHDKIREAICPKITEEGAWLLSEILTTFEVDVSHMTDEEFERCLGEKFDSIAYFENVTEEMKTGRRMMPKSVDIGDQVSQDIGVFYPTPIDNYAKIVRGCRYYGRYMDDIYVIGATREEVKSILEGIAKKAAELGLFINEKKTHIAKLSDNFKYLQIRYTLTETGKVIRRINPKNVTRERRKLKAYKRLLDRGEIEYEDIELSFMSWLGDAYKYMSNLQIDNMLNLYHELFGRIPTWKRHSRLRYRTALYLRTSDSRETTTSRRKRSQLMTSKAN